ncbi:MAG TPA: translation initiation factor IF-3 [Rhizomicrobium sp.]|nr:translation initiation factor IF-3 [Rhizomicrobium sp.]
MEPKDQRDGKACGCTKERVIVPRRFQGNAPPPAKDGPHINDEITSKIILLIGDDGHKYGAIGLDEALALAEEKGFDLVEVSPEAKPPVVKLMDYGKYKYEQQKKAAEARKKQKVIEIKEIKMRPTIDDHDYDVKMRAMKRFFDEGDKVKVTLRFRGREMAHQHLGMDLLNRVQKDTEVFAKLEQYPKMEGRQMMMVLAPR